MTVDKRGTGAAAPLHSNPTMARRATAVVALMMLLLSALLAGTAAADDASSPSEAAAASSEGEATGSQDASEAADDATDDCRDDLGKDAVQYVVGDVFQVSDGVASATFSIAEDACATTVNLDFFHLPLGTDNWKQYDEQVLIDTVQGEFEPGGPYTLEIPFDEDLCAWQLDLYTGETDGVPPHRPDDFVRSALGGSATECVEEPSEPVDEEVTETPVPIEKEDVPETVPVGGAEVPVPERVDTGAGGLADAGDRTTAGVAGMGATALIALAALRRRRTGTGGS